MIRPSPASSLAQRLAEELGVTTTFGDVLHRRGYGADPETRRFLEPRLSQLSSPHEMADRAKAIDRAAYAVRSKQPIALFGDYDCDGITSVAILTEVIQALGGDVTPVLADRFAGGYGVTNAAADAIIDLHPSVLITCDCGSSDHERLARIASHGIDIIVIDHHLVPDEPLPAIAFLNPHRHDCPFTYKHLSSCGLALSLAAGLRASLDANLDVRRWLDLVAIGTVADVVPLDGDNRVLVRAGMRLLEQGLRPGIRQLADLARVNLACGVTSETIAFDIAPRINAPGRLGSPRPALDLLLAKDTASARAHACRVEAIRTERRQIQEQILKEALADIETNGYDRDPAIVLGRRGWHPGIVGIVASHITDRFHKPTIVIALDDPTGRGSARGPDGTPVYDLLSASKGAPITFGGHQAAAGLEVSEAALPRLRELFNAAALAYSERTQADGAACADPSEAEVCLDDKDQPFDVVSDLARLEPCGVGNPLPRMAIVGARVLKAQAVKGGHLQLRLAINGHAVVHGFGYCMGERAKELAPESFVDLVGWLRRDSFRGGGSVAVRIHSVELSG